MTAVQSPARPLARRKIAIIGAGMIGGVHRRAAQLAGAEVVGVLASTPRRSTEVADSWQVATGFENIDAVLDSAADVVHICAPNALHAPYALAALAAGKHVVCEKPLGLTLAEAAAMDAAVGAHQVATVPFVYRYHPLVHEIRARRESGDFGRWTLLHGSYLQDWMLDPAAGGWRVHPELGGQSRAFADIGSHWCDLVEWVSGERIVSLSAALSTAHPRRPPPGSTHSFDSTLSNDGAHASGSVLTAVPSTVQVATEDSAVVSFRTASGVLGSVTVSQVSAGRKNRLWFELDGTAGSARRPSGSDRRTAQRFSPARPTTGRSHSVTGHRYPPVTTVAMRSVSKTSWPTPTPPSTVNDPNRCPPSPTGCAPPDSLTPCCARPPPAAGPTSPPDRTPAPQRRGAPHTTSRRNRCPPIRSSPAAASSSAARPSSPASPPVRSWPAAPPRRPEPPGPRAPPWMPGRPSRLD